MEEPYVGLGHFTEEYADRFFGRDTECSLIIGNLRAARLTLLYAESGVGKSSVLRAGVVARLHGFAENDLRARGRPRLVPVVFSAWSEAPVAALVRAIAEAVGPYLTGDASLELPEDDLERALEAASAALDTTLLVVLDQFEEYFLYPDEQPEGNRVADQIARCVNHAGLRANFLISIREDSYARLGDLFRGKVTNVYANFLHLDFLDRGGARESIEKPIERVNELQANGQPYELEPALVDAVLDEVGRDQIEAADEDGHRDGGDHRDEIETTYLQLVMRRLWEEETGAGSQRLRLQTLERLGGSQAVITSHLDRAMDDETDGAGLTDAQRLVAASIFHFLVTSGGTKIALTAKDLSDLSGRPLAEVEPVLRHLSSPALHILRPVVSENGQGEPRFEIFHDALARPIVAWRGRVEAAELDARLERERAEKEKAQRAAVEAEQREASERRRKRLALALLGVAVVAMLAILVGSLVEQRDLADQRDKANQSVAAVERMSNLSGSPTFGLGALALASAEAYGLSHTREARNLALKSLGANVGLGRVAVGHTGAVRSVAFWPDSDAFVTGGYDRTVRLWDARGEEIGSPQVNPTEVASVAVSVLPDGTRVLAAGLDGGIVKLWTVAESGRLRSVDTLRTHAGFAQGLAFDPRNPSLLAAGGLGARISLWDVSNPSHARPLGSRRTDGGVSDLAFTASGRKLLAASAIGEAWRVSDAGFLDPGSDSLDPRVVWSVATARNGSYAFGTETGVDVWDAARGRKRYIRLPGEVESLAFARGGSVLVTGDNDWNVTTWDVASGRPFGPPRFTLGTPVLDVAVSPDGETIAGGGAEGLVKLWPLDPAHPLASTVGGLSPEELGYALPVLRSLTANDDGTVAVAGTKGTSVWRLGDRGESGLAPRPLTRVPGASAAVALDGDLLAVARGNAFVLEDIGAGCASMPAEPCKLGIPARPHSVAPVRSMVLAEHRHRLLLASSGQREGDSVLNLWDVTDTARTGEIKHLSLRRIHTKAHGGINQVAFSRADSLVAVATEDGKLRVWDIRIPSRPRGIEISDARGNEDQPVRAIAFSPGGEWLASGGGDKQVVLWKVTRHGSGAPTVEATPGALFQEQTVLSIGFSPNGETLAVGGEEGRTCLYEVEDRTPLGQCLVGHATEGGGQGIKAVDFVPLPGGGSVLLTTGVGQPIVAWRSILWNLSDNEQVDQGILANLCAIGGRNLTSNEWSFVFGSTDLAGERHKTCERYPLLVGGDE